MMKRFYRSTLHMSSATATLWQSDTIWGHLCWSIIRHKDEKYLKEKFIDKYRKGEAPILVSNGFPSGFINRPAFLQISSDYTDMKKVERIKKEREIKNLLKNPWITIQEFNQVIKGDKESNTLNQPDEIFRVVSKNRIDRDTGTTSGEAGQLFDFAETYWKDVDIYWKISEDFEPMVKRFLNDLVVTGFGKRKSVGYGQVKSFNLEPFNGFEVVSDANGFITLSQFMPAQKDPTDGFWKTHVKYGKLGEEAAFSNPFKRPLIFFESGSAFYDKPVREWYGRLVENVIPGTPTVQYAFAFPVPVKMNNKSDK